MYTAVKSDALREADHDESAERSALASVENSTSMECVGRITQKAVFQNVFHADEGPNLQLLATKAEK